MAKQGDGSFRRLVFSAPPAARRTLEVNQHPTPRSIHVRLAAAIMNGRKRLSAPNFQPSIASTPVRPKFCRRFDRKFRGALRSRWDYCVRTLSLP
jgi:hypothetical protein